MEGFFKKNTCRKGSVLVIAVLLSSTFFSIGIVLATILQKEVIRQGIATRSSVASNIVHDAFECALYNDFRRGVFNDTIFSSGGVNNVVDCGSVYKVRALTRGGLSEEEYVALNNGSAFSNPGKQRGEGHFEFVILRNDRVDGANQEQAPCAHVVVRKECATREQGCSSETIKSYVEIRGYFSCRSFLSNDDRSVVRRLRVFYN